MALIAKAAYQNETFRIITGTARYTIPPTNKHDEPTDLQNHNEMLYPFKTLKYRYEYCTEERQDIRISRAARWSLTPRRTA